MSKEQNNLDKLLNTNIKLSDFAYHVDEMNSGYDRDAVFHYLEDFLKSKGIKIDIERGIRFEAGWTEEELDNID